MTSIRERLGALVLDGSSPQGRHTKESWKKQAGSPRAPLDRQGHRSCWSNDEELRHDTDGRTRHRHTCVATTVLVVGRIID